MDPSEPSTTQDRGRAAATRAIGVLAVGGVIALAALIARELLPHHAGARGHTSTSDVAPPVVPDAPPPRAPRSAPAPRVASLPTAAPEAAPSPRPSSSASAPPAVPLAASVIALVAANPEAFAPSTVFAPPAARDQVYSFEPLPPFNSTTLKRTRKNPSAWELDAMHGPKMKDLGPEGAVREAALVRDSIGNETPWFAIEAGPLAPAYAVMQGSAMRVMSRAFLLENRASLPPEVASALDR